MNCKGLEYEISGLHPDSSCRSGDQQLRGESSDDSLAIKFSTKLIEALREEVRDHNKSNPKSKTSLAELKDVYRRGSGNTHPFENKTLGQCAYARVNMFLRMKGEGKALTESKMKKISLEDLDFTDGFIPSQEDFDWAQEKITKYDLDYDFKNINDLYIENYKNISIIW
jgi:hypothetical protein